jgi:hypothetical protein
MDPFWKAFFFLKKSVTECTVVALSSSLSIMEKSFRGNDLLMLRTPAWTPQAALDNILQANDVFLFVRAASGINDQRLESRKSEFVSLNIFIDIRPEQLSTSLVRTIRPVSNASANRSTIQLSPARSNIFVMIFSMSIVTLVVMRRSLRGPLATKA